MSFRCHRKRIDWFASTLPFWSIFGCPRWRSETIKLHVVKQVNYGHATNTRACDIFGHRFHFDAIIHTHTICMPIRFDRYVFDENAQCISVDARPKRIEMPKCIENALMCHVTDGASVTWIGKVVLTKGAWRLLRVSLETLPVIVSMINALI